MDLDETRNISEGSRCTLIKKNSWEIAPGVASKDAKTRFVLFITNTMRTFGHLSCTDLDCFWNKRRELVSACIHRWKFPNLCAEIFIGCKISLKWALLRDVCDNATAQTAQFRAMGIVLGPSQHPKDVPFVSEFWWETYGLGTISPRKQQISSKFQISNS